MLQHSNTVLHLSCMLNQMPAFRNVIKYVLIILTQTSQVSGTHLKHIILTQTSQVSDTHLKHIIYLERFTEVSQ